MPTLILLNEKEPKIKTTRGKPTVTDIWIPGNVPSLKNSRISCAKGSFYSKTVRRYLQSLGIRSFSTRSGVVEYKVRPNIFREAVSSKFEALSYPAIIGFHFVRGTRHRFDFHNCVQILADLLVAHGCLPDDDMDHFIPVAIPKLESKQWYSYDKNNPGVVIRV